MGWFSMLGMSLFSKAITIGGIVMYPSFRILPKKISLLLKMSVKVTVIFKIWVGSSLNCPLMTLGTAKRLAVRKFVLKVTCWFNGMRSSSSYLTFITYYSIFQLIIAYCSILQHKIAYYSMQLQPIQAPNHKSNPKHQEKKFREK